MTTVPPTATSNFFSLRSSAASAERFSSSECFSICSSSDRTSASAEVISASSSVVSSRASACAAETIVSAFASAASRFSVSVVTFPAYEETVAELRNASAPVILSPTSKLRLRSSQIAIEKLRSR